MPENNTRTFILNDETKINSYNFRTLNKGIDLKRFKKNPVCLDGHWASNQRVIGKWTNIRIEGSLLKADIEFDMEDENAAAIAGKVERGFINGASMGINPERESFKLEPKGGWVLEKCELMEASVVAIPSNANAVKLYAESGDVLDKDAIDLSIPEWMPNKANKQIDMKEVKLSVAALVVLGLDKLSTVTTDDVAPAVEKLAADYKALEAKLTAAEEKLGAQAKLNATQLVETAIQAGKLEAGVKEPWINMAMNDFDSTSKAIASMPAKKSLSALVDNKGDEEMTQEAFFKLSTDEQLKFKAEQPAVYQKLFNQ